MSKVPPAAAPALRLRPIAPNPAGGIETLFAIEGRIAPGAKTPDRIEGADHPGLMAPPEGAARRLRLFHVNDLHNHLYDETAGGRPVHRLAEMAAIVARARAQAPGDEAVLFLSAGDDHTGTPLDELLGWCDQSFQLDPGYRALSAAGVDAATLGNHEFDRGARQLALGAADAAFPLLSANLHDSAHLKPGRHYHPALIARVRGLRVAIIGLTTRVETRTGTASDPGLTIASPVETLGRLLPLLAPLADIVVIASHCGYGDGAHTSGKASVARDLGEADFALAELTGRICAKPAVIVGAHTHTRLNEHGVEPENLRAGVLITQAGANGRFLGEIVIGRQGAVPAAARLHPIGARPESEPSPPAERRFAQRHIEPLRARVASLMGEVIGEVTGGEMRWSQTREDRYTGECALANFMNDAAVTALSENAETRVDLAFMNGGSLLAGLEPGPLSYGQWFRVMPYSDEVYILRMTGAQIEALVHNNATRLLRPGERAATDLGGFVARGFLHVSSGLRYRIEPGADAGAARARDIRLLDAPIADQRERELHVAMTTYLALGSFGERWNGAPLAGGIPGDLPGFDLRRFARRNTGLVYRTMLTEHIRSRRRLSARTDGRLRIS